MDDGMDELLGEFLVESFENLDQLDQDLIALEQDPGDLEVLKRIFRNIHTIKGTCGFLGFGKLESITHVGENLLSMLRDGVAVVDEPVASALLAMTGAVREIMVEIENTQGEGDGDYTQLVATLTGLQQRAEQGAQAADAEPEEPEAEAPAEAPVAEAPAESPAATADLDEDGDKIGELLVKQGAASEVDVAVGLMQQGSGDPRHLGEILVETGVLEPGQVRETLETQKESRSSVADSVIRVDVGLLDRLMTLVGELVLARNQILQCAASPGADPTLVSTTQRLNMITTELQAGVMKTRMQPIGNVWSKFPRVVRDLATSCGKRVRIEMEGKETELDKTIIEAIKDPLTHLVRNSVDHGIEMPDVRAAKGKSPEGLLLLRAYHEGGQVNIEITDDGAGIDVERVKAKAIERGLVTADQAARMSEREAVNLIFLPGFSTAEKVTNISGRGVGMDVVRSNIEKIGGTFDVHNRPGEGTTLRIKIPLTLAIIPALVVTSGGDRYAIPQVSLLELVGLDGEQARTGIETVHGTPVYRLRGNILPIVYLDSELGVNGHHDRDALTIVVLRADDREFGLVVDEVNDTEEIVVKPLSPQIKDIPAFSGCTIMGDGQVALILDVLGLAQRAHVVSEVREQAVAEKHDHDEAAGSDTETMLVLKVGTTGRTAIPLAVVDRLEEFQRSAVELTAGRQVVQYRGGVLPLLDVCSTLGYEAVYGDDDSTLQVVVYSENGRMVGLVVDRILDIVEEPVVVHQQSERYGIVGTTLLQGTVTDLLAIHDIIRSFDPTFYDGEAVDARSMSHV